MGIVSCLDALDTLSKCFFQFPPFRAIFYVGSVTSGGPLTAPLQTRSTSITGGDKLSGLVQLLES